MAYRNISPVEVVIPLPKEDAKGMRLVDYQLLKIKKSLEKSSYSIFVS